MPVGETQRRPGLHIERPSKVMGYGHYAPYDPTCGSLFRDIAWGLGYCDKEGFPVEGIFMASNVDDSCCVWPVLITDPHEVTDKHGSVEHMRKYMVETGIQPRMLKANQLTWITDRTPHETLPVKAPKDDPGATHVYRQWFRLVAGPISVWYSRHNTPNPLGIQPDAQISDENKFE